MKKIILGFAVLFVSVFSVAQASENKDKYSPNPLYIAEFMSNFKTVGECLTGLEEAGFIAQYEHENIIKILNEKNISLDEKIELAQVKDHEMKFGKQTLIIQNSDTLKTQDGVFIHLKKYTSADQVFLKTLEAFGPQKTSWIKSLILPEANAQGMPTELRGVEMALAAVTYHGVKTVYSASQVVWAVGGNVVGFITKPIGIGIANLIYKGKVECEDEDYVMNTGYSGANWLEDYKYWKKDAEQLIAKSKTPKNFKNFGDDFDSAGIGYSATLRGASVAGVGMIVNTFSPNKNNTYSISAKMLESILGKPIPKCNKANSEKVTAQVKVEAKKIQANLKQAMAKARSKSDSSPKNKGTKKAKQNT